MPSKRCAGEGDGLQEGVGLGWEGWGEVTGKLRLSMVPCLCGLQVVFLGKRLPYILAAVSADGCLRLWNVKLMQLLAEIQVSQDSLTAVCVDPAQTHLVAADSAGFVHTYNIAAWKGAKGKLTVRALQSCICLQHSGRVQLCMHNKARCELPGSHKVHAVYSVHRAACCGLKCASGLF